MKGMVIGLLAALTLTLGFVAASEHTRASDAEAKITQLNKNVDEGIDQWIEAQDEIKNLTKSVDYWKQAYADSVNEVVRWTHAWRGCEDYFQDLDAQCRRSR